jgi:hypothetical protein
MELLEEYERGGGRRIGVNGAEGVRYMHGMSGMSESEGPTMLATKCR